MTREWPGAEGISTDGPMGRARWDVPGHRRSGLRLLHRLNRYGLVLRSPSVRPLDEDTEPGIATLPGIAQCLDDPAFVGVIALKGDAIRLEAYARDFHARHVHSIQSISKMLVNLLAARCLGRGLIDLQRRTADYLPGIGGGYAGASVQQLLDMNVANGYVEDYTDPGSDVGRLECVHGWRIDTGNRGLALRDYLVSIGGHARPSEQGEIQYKTANTDIAAWICERVAGQALRESLLELIEQAGMEHAVYVSTDRDGVPFLGGGLHMTLRDLARLGRLFCFDSPDGASQHGLVREALANADAGTRYGDGTGYRNFLETDGRFVGHLGYGGQYLYVEPANSIVVAAYNATEGDDGLDYEFIVRQRSACRRIARAIDGTSQDDAAVGQ